MPKDKKLIFKVQGSNPEPYKVVFSKNENNLTATCSCQAALNRLHCKHRLNILNGITKNIVSNNLKDVEAVLAWLSGSDVEAVMIELQKAEKAFELLKKTLSNLKRKLARKLAD